MRWELAEEQEQFQGSFRGWLDKVASSDAVRGWLESGDPGPFEQRLAEEGWLAVGSPEERGGQGGGLLELALTAEELARAAAPSSAWLSSVVALPALPDDVAEDVLGGGGFAALVVDGNQPVDALDAADPAGAVSSDDDGRLHGSVSMVVGADRAARLVVPAHTGGARRLYLVEAAADGVTVTPRTLLDRSRSVGDVQLEGAVGVPLDVDADAALSEAALRAAVLTSADALGAMQRMLDLAVEYSLQRRQFGVQIGSFQAVKHAAASILVSVEAARSISYYAAASVDAGQPDRATHAAIAKAQVTPAGRVAGDSALTMHGAIGYTWEHDLHLFYKRARLDERLWGQPAVWNERIAAALELVPASA